MSFQKYKYLRKAGVLFLWLLVWQIAAAAIGREVLMPPPVKVFLRLLDLVGEPAFWRTVGTSFASISAGFFMAAFTGSFLAILSCRFSLFQEFIQPIITLMKATPVSSLIILILLFVRARQLSIVIAFLMVTPIFYTNVLQGILYTDKALLEMARVFRLSRSRKVKAIYLPGILPYFLSACTTGFGFAWKSGVAAEIIGLPANTIGNRLYSAKIILDTVDVYAWTLVVITLSLLLEKLAAAILKYPPKDM